MGAILRAIQAGFASGTVLNQIAKKFPQAAYYINTAQNAGYTANNILKSLAKDTENPDEAYLTEHEQINRRDKQQKRAAALGLVGAAGTAGAIAAGAYSAARRNAPIQPQVLPAQRPPPAQPGATINVTPKPRPGLPPPKLGLPGPQPQPRGPKGRPPSSAQPPIPMEGPKPEDLLPDVPELRSLQRKEAETKQLWDLAQRGKTGGNQFLKTSKTLLKDGTIADMAGFASFHNWWKATEGQPRSHPLVEYERFRTQTRGMREPPTTPQERPHVRPQPQIAPEQELPPPSQEVGAEPEAQPEAEQMPQIGIRERTQQAAFAEAPELKTLLDRTYKGKEFSIPTYRFPGESAEDFRVRHTIDTAIKKAAEAISKGESFLDYFEAHRKEPGAEWMMKMPEHLKESGMFLSTEMDVLKFLAGAGGPLAGPYEKLLDDREKEELMNGLSGDRNIYGALMTPSMVWNMLVTIEPKLATIKEVPRIKGGRKEKISFNLTNMGRFLTHAVYGVISGKNISPELADKIARISVATHGLDVIAKAAKEGRFNAAMAEMKRLADDEAFMDLFTDEVEEMVAQFGVKGMQPPKGSAADTKAANEIKKKFEENKQPKISEDLLPLYADLKDNGAEVDKNGNVTVYHRTSPENLENILKNKKMQAKEDGVFFSTSPNGQAEAYGKALLKLKVPLSLLELDDVFGDEAHVRIPLKSKKHTIDISKFL